MRDERSGRASEQFEQIIDETEMSRLSGYNRFEDESGADLLYLSQGALVFEPPDDRLDGCVSDLFVFGQSFVNLSDRAVAEAPEDLHDFDLKLGKPDRLFPRHGFSWV